MPDMREIILRPPETAMDNEEQREWSFALGKSKLSELTWIITIVDPHVKRR